MKRQSPKLRQSYKPNVRDKVAAIEERRKALGISVSELAYRAQSNRATLDRIRKTGCAWSRELRALSMALRTLEAEARRAGNLFPGDE